MTSSKPPAELTIAPGRGKTVLIVDDEFLIRWALRERLTAAGFTVLEAHNLASARELFFHGVDLVLLDIALPDGNGMELLVEMRGARPQTHVILVTAHATDHAAEQAVAAGAFALIHKPFDLSEVVRLTLAAISS